MNLTLSFYVRWNIDAQRILFRAGYINTLGCMQSSMPTQSLGRPALPVFEIDTVSAAHTAKERDLINVTGKIISH